MLSFRIKSEVMKIGKNKGKTMFFASQVQQPKLTAQQVEDRIVNLTALSRADIRSAITALAEVVRDEMLAGRSIDLADLGTFKVVSNGKRMTTEKEVTEATLKTPRIQFFPKQEMRQQASNVHREILRPGQTKPKTQTKPEGEPEHP